MNGNQDLTKLAGDPRAFDTELAGLHKQQDNLRDRINAAGQAAHREAGDKSRYVGRKPTWGMTAAAALAKAPIARAQRDNLLAELAPVREAIRAMNEVYTRAPWPRFFPSITKSHPHIHASLGCRTLHIDTRMTWAPALSGKTEAEAVVELDEALCTVCFPTAPVALHNYVSKRSQTERDERAAEKTARDAAKAAKTLTSGEQFKDGNDWRVTTVAGAKTVIRQAIEEEHYYPRTWASDSAKFITAAETAERVLLAREARQEGAGATAGEIAKIRESAERKAKRETAGR